MDKLVGKFDEEEKPVMVMLLFPSGPVKEKMEPYTVAPDHKFEKVILIEPYVPKPVALGFAYTVTDVFPANTFTP